MTKKLSKKTNNIIVGVLIAVGSFISGIVSQKSPELGKLIKEVVQAVTPSIVNNTLDSVATYN